MDVVEQVEVVGLNAAPGPRARRCQDATVVGSNPSTEANVVGQQQWEAIRALSAAGHTVSAIARELGLDRKTVRRARQAPVWLPYQRTLTAASLLDSHRAWLTERAAQVQYSARILFQELRAERGYRGSYGLVKLAVRPLRAAANVAALTQCRFETEPGEQAQVDWGQLTVRLAGVPVKVHVFVMTLGYSRRAYAEGFEHERMENLLAAHERAFEHFGGVCQKLLYDRMRTVVVGRDRARAQINSTFEAFSRHWGFAVKLCRAYRPQTKGKVESGVKYIKGNFAPGRTFADLADFNAQLASWQATIADQREHGTTHQRPAERFAAEAAALTPLSGQRSFLQATVRERVVAGDWLVAIDANRYSVPFALIGQTVQVVREADHWLIRHRGRVVAKHPALTGRSQLSVRPEHGPGAVARNARIRFAQGTSARGERHHEIGREVEVRDPALYDRLLEPA